MKITKKFAIVIPMTLALVIPAEADWHDTADALLACYGKAAAKFGSESCQPPPALVGAVFGECASAENALGRALTEMNSNTSTEDQDRLIDRIHHNKTPEIENVILKTQIQRGKCH